MRTDRQTDRQTDRHSHIDSAKRFTRATVVGVVTIEQQGRKAVLGFIELFLFFLGLFQCWFTAMPLSPVSNYVYASFPSLLVLDFVLLYFVFGCFK